MDIVTVILAAGKGSRMKVNQHKCLCKVAGVPMIHHSILKGINLKSSKIIIVLSNGMKDVEDYVTSTFPKENILFAIQEEQKGSAHALMAALTYYNSDSDNNILVLYADTPLVLDSDLESLAMNCHNTDVSMIGFSLNGNPDDYKYGRVICDSAEPSVVERIVEYKDCNLVERQCNVYNSGIMLLSPIAINLVQDIKDSNKSKEYYLTDIVSITNNNGGVSKVFMGSARHLQGANTLLELSKLEGIFQQDKRETLMLSGVYMQDPESIYFSLDTKVEPNVSLSHNISFGLGVSIERCSSILPYTYIEHVSVGSNCTLGPFARIRGASTLEDNAKVGTFVDFKNSHLSPGAKVPHLSYIGDSNIGANVNIGAGSITCNYDGKNKHNTNIGDNAFVGSNVSMIAPINIGSNAVIGAGTTVSKDVADYSLEVSKRDNRKIVNYKKAPHGKS